MTEKPFWCKLGLHCYHDTKSEEELTFHKLPSGGKKTAYSIFKYYKECCKCGKVHIKETLMPVMSIY